MTQISPSAREAAEKVAGRWALQEFPGVFDQDAIRRRADYILVWREALRWKEQQGKPEAVIDD